MNKIGIKTKLIGLSSFLAITIIFIGIIGYFSTLKVQSKYQIIVNKNVPSLEFSSEMFLNYRQVRITLRTLGLSGLDQENANLAIAGVKDSIKKYEEANLAYINLGFSNEIQKELYSNTNKAWLEFKKIGDTVLTLYESGKPDDQKKIMYIFMHDCPEKAKVFRASIEALNAFHKKEILDANKLAESTASNTFVFTWSVIIFTAIISLLGGLFISISTVKELSSIANNLIENSNEVSGTVSDLTASSDTLSASSNEQAASVQQTASSIEEIKAMVQRNTENSMESAKLSSQSKEEANLGKKSVEEMIAAIDDINISNKNIQEEVQSGNKRIAEIITVIQEIETKTKVINEIVFQTKLLSFNASVEAARAGEHGKGFAVVAEEVGNLANMSGKASQEITSLLSQSTAKVNEIVKETSTSIESLMVTARSKVEHGGKVAQSCSFALEKIVLNADQLSQMVESISSASQEQSLGIKEISRAIQQLDETIQTNSAETKSTTSSATHLGNQVRSLNVSSGRLMILIDGGANTSGTLVNKFIWKNQYSLDVPKMDEEHKVLIEKINLFASSINQGKESQDMIILFRDLASYTKEHFKDEEEYLNSINYPDLSNHKNIHRKLLAQMGEYEQELSGGNINSGAIIIFLNDWLIKHIMGVDMKYSRFVKTGSVKRSAHKSA